jgi:hypothetical protein
MKFDQRRGTADFPVALFANISCADADCSGLRVGKPFSGRYDDEQEHNNKPRNISNTPL